MTYDPTSPSSPEPDESSPVADAMADAREAFNRSGFSTPTGMVALAAFVLIGVELIFNVIMSEYGIDWSLLALALLAVIVYFGKGAYDRVAPVDALLKLVGMLIASLVAFHILW